MKYFIYWKKNFMIYTPSSPNETGLNEHTHLIYTRNHAKNVWIKIICIPTAQRNAPRGEGCVHIPPPLRLTPENEFRVVPMIQFFPSQSNVFSQIVFYFNDALFRIQSLRYAFLNIILSTYVCVLNRFGKFCNTANSCKKSFIISYFTEQSNEMLITH